MTPRVLLVLLSLATPSAMCFAQEGSPAVPAHSENPFPSPWGSEGVPPVMPAAPGGHVPPPIPEGPAARPAVIDGDKGEAANRPKGDRYTKEEAEIPKTPSAPPVLGQKSPEESFHCQRFFTFQGKRYGCDSNVRLDGERLRPIIRDVPAAVAELDTYQANRFKVRSAAYVGGAGLMLAIVGSIASTQFNDSNTQATVRNVSAIGGVGLAVGAFLYGLGYIRSNERHIVQAVNNFNVARPRTPIELNFNLDL